MYTLAAAECVWASTINRKPLPALYGAADGDTPRNAVNTAPEAVSSSPATMAKVVSSLRPLGDPCLPGGPGQHMAQGHSLALSTRLWADFFRGLLWHKGIAIHLEEGIVHVYPETLHERVLMASAR